MVRVAEQMSANLMAGCSYSSSGDRVYTLKFVLVGSRGVGKTRLASLFHRKNGGGGCPSAVGMQFATRTLRYGDSLSVRAQIWDTAGTFPLKSVKDAYFGGTVGAMLVYDISKRSTFDDLARWLSLVRENSHKSVALILVGNKSDMSTTQREVSMVEGMRFARKHGMDFVETSALRAEHVEEACRQLIMSVARYLPQDKSVWSKKKRSHPLPLGWIPITAADWANDVIGGNEENTNPAIAIKMGGGGGGENAVSDRETPGDTDIDTDSDDAALMPPPPPPPPPPHPSRTPGVGLPYSGTPITTTAVSRSPPPEGGGRATSKVFGSSSVKPRGFCSSQNNNGGGNGGYNHHQRASSEPPAAAGVAAGATGGATRHNSVSPPRILWYENAWTGERVSRRPLYPAGPSEACVVSQVPRAWTPVPCLPDPVKAKRRGFVFGGGDRGESGAAMIGDRSSWSFSSFKSRGYAAAAECLSKCLDP